ncbi:exodeoxyribonuclease VII small subunit [Treponema putidum]|uniref:Exodeoxyribonuclease 7 small subunit n=1 Tax=Treponema putidum TaxID=221027 RepID=A0ABY5HUM6_9SPIR|nr:exodeoxyribonuclease VII small subunit [Treponema putidum]AIN92823.1 exodeoxyribonuclease VII [Treponema putidum]TWI74051.1 exodeoxyribonuclease VII small subunit [Treponema putidum]UTY29076.1 exodeoxyribonuclease VII small subunit [Treponema putidum]
MKKFEERLERLEKISDDIRSSDIPLEKALSLFEEGIKLAKGLEKDIEKMEGKIQILVNQPVLPEEEPELDLFAGTGED